MNGHRLVYVLNQSPASWSSTKDMLTLPGSLEETWPWLASFGQSFSPCIFYWFLWKAESRLEDKLTVAWSLGHGHFPKVDKLGRLIPHFPCQLAFTVKSVKPLYVNESEWKSNTSHATMPMSSHVPLSDIWIRWVSQAAQCTGFWWSTTAPGAPLEKLLVLIPISSAVDLVDLVDLADLALAPTGSPGENAVGENADATGDWTAQHCVDLDLMRAVDRRNGLVWGVARCSWKGGEAEIGRKGESRSCHRSHRVRGWGWDSIQQTCHVSHARCGEPQIWSIAFGEAIEFHQFSPFGPCKRNIARYRIWSRSL